MEWVRGMGQGRREVRILFTSAGRRVELMQAFTHAARALKLRPILHVADAEPNIAAACQADHAHQVPPASSTGYINALLRIVRREKIDLLIPLIDSELLQLAEARDRFAKSDCAVVISSQEVVATCRDKLRMFDFLAEHQIDTPRTWTAETIMKRRQHAFPYFLKPRFGSASKGNYVVHDRATLKMLVPWVPEVIIQEFAEGVEHTLDVYAGYDGRPRCVVPRQRVEVRGGEVTRARTVKHEAIMATGVRVTEALDECIGLVTIQLILAPDGRIRVIEVNPRFGGGVPLAIHAGADFPKWLLAEWCGTRPRIRLDHFRDQVMMMRYHQAFFRNGVKDPRKAPQ